MKTIGVIVAGIAALTAMSEWIVGQYLCGWDFCYPLDDTYIHLAIARQLAETGTWGVEPGVPVFASSSPLWTLLLAGVTKLVGVRDWVPLCLSFVFSFASVSFAFRFWQKTSVPTWFAAVSGVVLVLVVPFVTLSNLGMEHALHFCLVEWLLCCAWTCLASERPSRAEVVCCAVASAFATAARYETLFLVAPMSLLLVCRRRCVCGVLSLVAAFVPVVGFGLFALSCGRPFFPISLLLKASVGADSIVSRACGFYSAISSDSIHVHLMILLLLVLSVRSKTNRIISSMSLVAAIAIVGHCVFAKIGWLYRYEAYLVGVCFTMLPAAVASVVPTKLAELAIEHHGCACPCDVVVKKMATLGLCIGISFPFLARSFKANYDTVVAMPEIHGQQMQMARIFSSLPTDMKGSVAVTDIGCVAMYSGAHVLDIWGLGSPEIADIRRGLRPKAPDVIYRLFKQHCVRYVAIYEGWYELSRLSPEIRVVAKLSMRTPRVICSGDTVLLCVTNPKDAELFKRHLMNYRKNLPSTVELVFDI